MSASLARFADVLSAELLHSGWLPVAAATEGCIRCLRGPKTELYLVDATGGEVYTSAAEPLAAPGGDRFILYLTEDELSDEQRSHLEGGGVGAVEIVSRTVTLPAAPAPLLKAVQAALAYSGPDIDYPALVRAEEQGVAEFQTWAAQIRPFWTPVFLVLCVLLTVGSELSGGSTDPYTMFRMGALWGPACSQLGEWWRLATANLLHFGWLHLAVNMFSLFSVGGVLECILGRRLYLVVLVASGLGGSLCSLWGNSQLLSAGLSGALFGLAASTCLLIYTRRLPLPQTAQRTLASGLLPAVVYNLLAGFALSGIDNYAHIGGLLTGTVCTWIAYPRRSATLRRPEVPLLLYALPAAYFVALVLGAAYYAANRMPMGQPQQQYTIGGASVRFGRAFRHVSSQGVIRVYNVPGCVLYFGVVPKLNWPEPKAFAAALRKEQPDLSVEERRIGGRACLLSRSTQNGKSTVSCRILDVGTDVIEVGVLGTFADGRRDLELLEAVVSTTQGPPSHWGPPD